MVGAISGGYPYLNYYQYRGVSRPEGQEQSQVQQAEKVGRSGKVLIAGRAANPDVPVEPVDPVRPVRNDFSDGLGQVIPFLRQGADPAEMAVRMRMQQYEPEGAEQAGESGGAGDIQKAAEDGKCETCENRKYQDGSDDPGVSFKTATRIAPEQAAAAVRGHEMEHVVREQASAAREDRKVVSQTVSIHTEICPECGDVYVSGGTTRTVTAAENQPEQAKPEEVLKERVPFFAVE